MARPQQYPHKLLIGFTDEQVAALDNWRRQQSDLPNRSEAIRRLVEKSLNDESAK